MEGVNLSDSGGATPEPKRSEKVLRVFLVVGSRDLKQELLLIVRRLDRVKTVAVTSNSERARVSIPDVGPDVVLLELPLIEGDGVSTLLPAIVGLPNPPAVVVLSDRASDVLREQCMAGGARAFLNTATEDLDRLPDVLAAL